MGRIRTIKPGFWTNEELSSLPEPTHLLAAGLLNYADDEGYFNANPALIKAELSPLREPSVSIHCSLSELSRIGYIALGTGGDGRRYGRVVNFTAHQRINRPSASKIAAISIAWDQFTEPSVSSHCILSEPSLPEGKGREGKGSGKEGMIGALAKAPTKRGSRLPEGWEPNEGNLAFAKQEGFSQTETLRLAAGFRDYWHALGGQKACKLDWDATWRNWVRTSRRPNGSAPKQVSVDELFKEGSDAHP